MLTKEAQTKSVAQKQTEYIYYMLPIQYKAQKQIWSHKTIKYFFYGILQKLFFFFKFKTSQMANWTTFYQMNG